MDRFRVEVIAKTPFPQQVIYAAMHQDYSDQFVVEERESWPSEEKCGEVIVKRLLAGERGHYGPLEHCQIVFNCGYFPHSVMQQARTHRVGISFDVQCLSSDVVITFVDINGESSKKLKKTIGELYDLWYYGEQAIRERKIKGRNDEPPGFYRRDCKNRIRKMRVRSLNEENNTFTYNHIEDIVFNGFNPVYQVTLADGKQLKCTQNHKILTPYGWRILAQLGVGSEVLVNGQPLKNADQTYQNKEWLESKFSEGLTPKEVAALIGCSVETVKKWAYYYELTWQKKQWNQGLKYKINISDEERERRANHGRAITALRVENGTILKGEHHPSWKPDLPVEKRVYHWLKSNRQRILEEKGEKCARCGGTRRLSIHHILEVSQHPELAFDETNLEVLCSPCHTRHHKQDRKNPLCAHPVKIVSIEYVGIEPTYDLVMAAPHHNFVANGVVVHNSYRYTSGKVLAVAEGKGDIEDAFYLRPVGYYSDRQGKKYYYSPEQRQQDLNWCLEAAKRYKIDLENGMSEEHARGKVPFDYRQHFVVSFTLRALLHFLDLRFKKDAQLEIQKLCDLMWPHVEEWVPDIAKWYQNTRLGKARLAP
jgi:thymidylate synthase (FAD)